MTITLTSEEAQQVLDAMESCDEFGTIEGLSKWYDRDLIDAAIKTLRARLALHDMNKAAECIAKQHEQMQMPKAGGEQQ